MIFKRYFLFLSRGVGAFLVTNGWRCESLLDCHVGYIIPQGSEWRIRPWRSYLTLDVSISPRTLGMLDLALNSIINNGADLPPPLSPCFFFLPPSILSLRHVIKIYFTFLLLHSHEKRDHICIIHSYTNLYVLLMAGNFSPPPFNICVYVAVKQWHSNNEQKMI